MTSIIRIKIKIRCKIISSNIYPSSPVLDDFQITAMTHIDKDENVLVTAHT